MYYNDNYLNYNKIYNNQTYEPKIHQQDASDGLPDGASGGQGTEPPIFNGDNDSISSVIPASSRNTFVKDGIEYECEQVYICRQIGYSLPQKIEPNPNETFIDINLWQDENIPEYKIEKCNNALGFCLRARNSTMRIIGRIVYPYDIEGELFSEIDDCFQTAISVASTVVAAQVSVITAAPESAPAILPNVLTTAYTKGNAAFFDCLSTKASYEYLKNKVKFSVFYEQESRGSSWHTFDERDALKLLEKFSLYSTGLILIPGIGSYADLADKIGIDREGIENFFKKGGDTLEKWGNEISGYFGF